MLVIDDDVRVGASLARSLSRECDAEVVTSGADALARFASGVRIDVVVCDLMMPDMTGMDRYAELERTEPSRLASMIFMTGGAVTARARAFLASVPNMHLDKPFTAEALGALVRSIAAGPGAAA